MKKLEKRVLVTGASGFIGQHLMQTLTDLGHAALALPRGHLYDPETLLYHLKALQPDWIFHLAAYGNMSHQQDELEIFRANTIGTWNLLSASKGISYEAFINVSSSSVLLPHETFYSATKAASERFVRAFVNKYDKPIVNIRPFSVYGPGEADYRFIPTVFKSCLTGEAMTLAPAAMHDWVYVGDFVESLIKAAKSGTGFQGQSFGVGTGIAQSNQQVVELIEHITGRRATISDYKQLRAFDTTEWRADFLDDLLTPTTLTDGLLKTYEYYEQRFKA